MSLPIICLSLVAVECGELRNNAKGESLNNLTKQEREAVIRKESESFLKELALAFKSGGFLQNEKYMIKGMTDVVVDYFEGQHPLVKTGREYRKYQYESNKDLASMDNDPFVDRDKLLFMLEHGKIIDVSDGVGSIFGDRAYIRIMDDKLLERYPDGPFIDLCKPPGRDRWGIMYVGFFIPDI